MRKYLIIILIIFSCNSTLNINNSKEIMGLNKFPTRNIYFDPNFSFYYYNKSSIGIGEIKASNIIEFEKFSLSPELSVQKAIGKFRNIENPEFIKIMQYLNTENLYEFTEYIKQSEKLNPNQNLIKTIGIYIPKYSKWIEKENIKFLILADLLAYDSILYDNCENKNFAFKEEKEKCNDYELRINTSIRIKIYNIELGKVQVDIAYGYNFSKKIDAECGSQLEFFPLKMKYRCQKPNITVIPNNLFYDNILNFQTYLQKIDQNKLQRPKW